MNIFYSKVKQDVKRHLSVIGKRLYSKEGKNMFSDITLSSAEDPILDQYMHAGLQNIESALSQVIEVVDYVTDSMQCKFTITTARDAIRDKSCERAAYSYLKLFVVGEYLAMTHPDLAEKYMRDVDGMMETLIATAFHKDPPNVTFSDTIGSVEP